VSASGAKAASLTNGGTAGATGPEADSFPRPDFSQMVPFKPKVCPEMEVTEIFLAKIDSFCQLSSRSRGFFARVQFFYSIFHKA
jgi:hypothetical protein